jgi:hypothetical protein
LFAGHLICRHIHRQCSRRPPKQPSASMRQRRIRVLQCAFSGFEWGLIATQGRPK